MPGCHCRAERTAIPVVGIYKLITHPQISSPSGGIIVLKTHESEEFIFGILAMRVLYDGGGVVHVEFFPVAPFLREVGGILPGHQQYVCVFYRLSGFIMGKSGQCLRIPYLKVQKRETECKYYSHED